MELRKFVTVSLHQIVWGINDAQEEFADTDFEVKFMKNNPLKTSTSEQVDEYHDINFNVAVMVEEQLEPPQTKLLVMGFAHLGMGYEQLLLLVSRIEFTVPVSFVPSMKKRYSTLKTHPWLNISH